MNTTGHSVVVIVVYALAFGIVWRDVLMEGWRNSWRKWWVRKSKGNCKTIPNNPPWWFKPFSCMPCMSGWFAFFMSLHCGRSWVEAIMIECIALACGITYERIKMRWL